MKLGQNFVKYFVRFLGYGVFLKKMFWDLLTFSDIKFCGNFIEFTKPPKIKLDENFRTLCTYISENEISLLATCYTRKIWFKKHHFWLFLTQVIFDLGEINLINLKTRQQKCLIQFIIKLKLEIFLNSRFYCS